MNSNIPLLFTLNIPCDFMKKLKDYYYIPENRITELKLGGYVYFVDKCILNKKLTYKGILTSIKTDLFCFKHNNKINILNSNVSIEEILKKYHIFYRPKHSKLQNAMRLLHSLENS